MGTTGWRSLSGLTLGARIWSWWKIAQICTSVSTLATSPLSMSWRATGCCMNTPITGDASTSCVLESTGGTVSGEAPAPPLAHWDGSPSSTDSQHFYPYWASPLSFPSSCSHKVSVWSQLCCVQTWNHTFQWWGFWCVWCWVLALLGCFALLGKVPPHLSAQAMLMVKSDDVPCFGRPVAKWFG